jgi:Uma2 family endonuclease
MMASTTMPGPRAHPSRPVLVVEIAERSCQVDRAHKASLYARAGVPECWIVDLRHAALEVHREPEAVPDAPYGWRYRRVATLRPPATVTALAAPDRAVSIADLLP